MALPPVIFIAAFVAFPVVIAIGLSLGFTGGLNEAVSRIGIGTQHAAHWWGTTAVYQELFADPRFARDLVVTLVVTVFATLGVLVLALAAALYLRLRGGWLANLFTGLAVIPLFIPVVIASWALLGFYSQEGFLRSVFAAVGLQGPTWGYTITGIVIGSIWTSLPFATLLIVSGVQGVPDALIDAARDSGAGLWGIIVRVLLPIARIPIIIAATFTAIGVLGQFTVPYFIGPSAPQVLGVDINSYFQSFDKPQESVAIAVVIFLLAATAAAFYVWANFRSESREAGGR